MSSENKARIELIAEELEKKLADTDITDETIYNKLGLTRSMYYRLKGDAVEILNQKLQKRLQKLEERRLQAMERQVDISISTKEERLKYYQTEIEYMQRQLSGRVEFTFISSGKIKSSHNKAGEFRLPVEVQNKIRDRIRWYQIEISKIEGDYAPQVVNVRGGFLDLFKEASQLKEQELNTVNTIQ